MVEIIENLVSSNMYSIKCPYAMTAEYITIHNTDNDAPAINEVKYMISNNNKTSFHVAIDDKQAVIGVPFNRNTWNAGDGRGDGNMKSISIEICYSMSGGSRFDKAEENCAEYVAYLLKQRGWGLDRVRTHKSWSGKNCPARTLQYGWDRFLQMIQNYLDGNNNNSNNEEGLEMARTYKNGSTAEPVYADTGLTKKVGSLNAYEVCEYLTIDNNRPLVRYKIDGSNALKCGYVKWKGGCQ